MKEITLAMLRNEQACEDQIEIFQSTFGERAEIAEANFHKAWADGLDMFWLLQFVTASAREEYNESCTLA